MAFSINVMVELILTLVLPAVVFVLVTFARTKTFAGVNAQIARRTVEGQMPCEVEGYGVQNVQDNPGNKLWL